MVLKDMTLERLAGSRRPLEGVRHARPPHRPAAASWTAWTPSTQQALGILTSSKMVDALDLSKETRRVLERYGVDDPAFERDGAPRMVRNFCIARRLVEAGARVVTLNFSRWDWHGADGKNFVQGRKDMPAARPGGLRPGDRSARARPGQRRVGGGLGRIRPDAAHQQERQPRSLAAGAAAP